MSRGHEFPHRILKDFVLVAGGQIESVVQFMVLAAQTFVQPLTYALFPILALRIFDWGVFFGSL